MGGWESFLARVCEAYNVFFFYRYIYFFKSLPCTHTNTVESSGKERTVLFVCGKAVFLSACGGGAVLLRVKLVCSPLIAGALVSVLQVFVCVWECFGASRRRQVCSGLSCVDVRSCCCGVQVCWVCLRERKKHVGGSLEDTS